MPLPLTPLNVVVPLPANCITVPKVCKVLRNVTRCALKIVSGPKAFVAPTAAVKQCFQHPIRWPTRCSCRVILSTGAAAVNVMSPPTPPIVAFVRGDVRTGDQRYGAVESHVAASRGQAEHVRRLSIEHNSTGNDARRADIDCAGRVDFRYWDKPTRGGRVSDPKTTCDAFSIVNDPSRWPCPTFALNSTAPARC